MRSEFMIERNGKTFCLYAGLLDEAHQQGLKEIRTSLIQIPSQDNGNVAICQSEVHTEKGIFTGLGDASPQNVARAMVTCLIRMAETRAKARALRDAVNVGVVALEELDSENGTGESEGGYTPPAPAAMNRNPGRIAQISAAPEVYGEQAMRKASPARPARPVSAEPMSRPAAPGPAEPVNRPTIDTSSEVSRNGAGRVAPTRKDLPQVGAAGTDSFGAEGLASTLNGSSRGGAPVEEGVSSDGGKNPADLMTSAQRRMLEALAQQAGEEVELEGLSRRQASQMISDLKGRLGQSRAA